MKLSVIIPVYNVEKYLTVTLESVLQQKHDDLEIILVDDGSLDQSGKICDDYAFKYPDIVQVYHIQNAGVSNARNLGLCKASGDYVHFMDSDDTLEYGMYKCFCEIVEDASPDVIVCGCKRINLMNDNVTLAHYDMDVELIDRYEIGDFLNQLNSEHKRWMLDYIWNKWYKRSFLVENELMYDTTLSLGEDFLFNCQVFSLASNTYISKEIFYSYYIRNSGLVTAFQPQPWIGRQVLTDAHMALYQSHGIFEENRDSILFEDGMLAFSELRSVNSPRCMLSKNETREFLEEMYHSKQMELALYYLKHSQKKLHKLWFALISIFCMRGVRMVILADKIDRLLKGKWILS